MAERKLEQKKTFTHAIALDWDKTFLNSHSHIIVCKCFNLIDKLRLDNPFWKENLQRFVDAFSPKELHPKDKSSLLRRLTHPIVINNLKQISQAYRKNGEIDHALYNIGLIILPTLSPSDAADNWCALLTEAAAKNIGIAIVTFSHPAIKRIIPFYLRAIIKLSPEIVKKVWLPECNISTQEGVGKNPVLINCIEHFNLGKEARLIYVDDTPDNVDPAFSSIDSVLAPKLQAILALSPETVTRIVSMNLQPLYKAEDAKKSSPSATPPSPLVEFSSPLALSQALSASSCSPSLASPSAFFSGSPSSSSSATIPSGVRVTAQESPKLDPFSG